MSRLLVTLCALSAIACPTAKSPDTEDATPPDVGVPPTETCPTYTPSKRAFFGELHSHTGFSFDARSYQNVLTPLILV